MPITIRRERVPKLDRYSSSKVESVVFEQINELLFTFFEQINELLYTNLFEDSSRVGRPKRED
jgi:hypothetical protein